MTAVCEPGQSMLGPTSDRFMPDCRHTKFTGLACLVIDRFDARCTDAFDTYV